MPNGTFSPVWVELFKVGHYGDGLTVTSSELSLIQRNFQKAGKPIPVGIGLNWSGSPLHGAIDQLEIRGDTLWGRLTNITPQMDEIISTGSASCKTASIAKSKDGLSLKRVGFASEPSYTTDKSHATRQDFEGNSEIHFFEDARCSSQYQPRQSIEFAENVAVQSGLQEIYRLKRQGNWPQAFDRFGFNQIFSLLEQSNTRLLFEEGVNLREGSLVRCFANFLEHVAPVVQSAEGVPGVARQDSELAAEARQLSRKRGLTFSDALDLAIQYQRIDRQLAEFAERGGTVGDEALHMQALRIVRETGVSYCDALDEAVQSRAH